jgi:Sec-independent protein translocase protein TatA
MSNDYVTLLGAEDVRSAARQMSSAANEMKQASANMDESFRRHQMFLDDWLRQFVNAIETLNARNGK